MYGHLRSESPGRGRLLQAQDGSGCASPFLEIIDGKRSLESGGQTPASWQCVLANLRPR